MIAGCGGWICSPTLSADFGDLLSSSGTSCTGLDQAWTKVLYTSKALVLLLSALSQLIVCIWRPLSFWFWAAFPSVCSVLRSPDSPSSAQPPTSSTHRANPPRLVLFWRAIDSSNLPDPSLDVALHVGQLLMIARGACLELLFFSFPLDSSAQLVYLNLSAGWAP